MPRAGGIVHAICFPAAPATSPPHTGSRRARQGFPYKFSPRRAGLCSAPCDGVSRGGGVLSRDGFACPFLDFSPARSLPSPFVRDSSDFLAGGAPVRFSYLSPRRAGLCSHGGFLLRPHGRGCAARNGVIIFFLPPRGGFFCTIRLRPVGAARAVAPCDTRRSRFFRFLREWCARRFFLSFSPPRGFVRPRDGFFARGGGAPRGCAPLPQVVFSLTDSRRARQGFPYKFLPRRAGLCSAPCDGVARGGGVLSRDRFACPFLDFSPARSLPSPFVRGSSARPAGGAPVRFSYLSPRHAGLCSRDGFFARGGGVCPRRRGSSARPASGAPIGFSYLSPRRAGLCSAAGFCSAHMVGRAPRGTGLSYFFVPLRGRLALRSRFFRSPREWCARPLFLSFSPPRGVLLRAAGFSSENASWRVARLPATVLSRGGITSPLVFFDCAERALLFAVSGVLRDRHAV